METVRRLTITSLGALRIALGDQPAALLTAQKAGALLVYLAYTGQPQAREHLADLFWSDRDSEHALGSLRMALSTLRRQFDLPLQATRRAIGLDSQQCFLDARQLLDAVDDFAHIRSCASAHQARSLEAALDLYHGDFLRDFFGGSPELETWLETTRDRLRAVYVQGTLMLAEYWVRQGADSEALIRLQRALQFDPLHEVINNQILLLLSRNGQIAKAVEHYQSFRDRLAVELEVEPSTQTRALMELLHERAVGDGTGAPFAAYFATPLIGREGLLMEVLAWVSEPGGRLLTLVGPGGIGKTRLALTAAEITRARRQYPDGVYFVPLGAYRSAAQIVTGIAAVLGYKPLADGRSLRQQVIDYVCDKHLLLVLDNYEHLLEDADLAVDLAACCGVGVLTTSREPLHVPQEQSLVITGLTYPVDGGPAPVYDSARLFVRAVQRAYPEYAPNEADYEPIARICRLVDGSPLGLLLASGWMDVLTPAEIAGLIAAGIRALENSVPGVDARHHSMKAVFAVTLDRLPPDLRAVFTQLAVFRGGSTRAAAQAVTGADLRALQSLAGRMLLMRDSAGRFRVHELLRQYAEERLQENDQYAAARSAHTAYFLQFLAEREADVKGRRQAAALKEIDEDFENIRAAWEWACSQDDFDRIDAALESLNEYCSFQQRQAERYVLLQMALDSVERAGQITLTGRLLARCWQTPAQGRARLRQALRIALHTEIEADIAYCIYQRGQVALLDNRDVAHKLFARAYAAYCELGDSFYRGLASSGLAVALIYAGRAGQAEQISGQELAAVRQSGNQFTLAAMLYNHASSLATRGANAEANRFHEEARAVMLAQGQRLLAADIHAWGMGVTALREGNFDVAEARALKLLEVAREYHSVVSEARALCILSAVALISGDPRRSYALAQSATDLLGSHANAAYADAFLAAGAAALGEFELAADACLRWLPLAVRVGEHVLTALLLTSAVGVLAGCGQADRVAACAALALNCPATMGHWARRVFTLYELEQDLSEARVDSSQPCELADVIQWLETANVQPRARVRHARLEKGAD